MAQQNTINLKEFNKTSAKHGRFPVTIFRGQVQKYTYEAKPSKKQVQAIKFECTLVGQDAGYYMKAFLKGTEKQVQTVSDKLKDGSKWILSKPALDSWTKPAYISTPIQFRINLASTELTKMEGAVQDMPLAPIPPRTIAETIGINTDRGQDILCLVKNTTNRRTIPDGTVLVDALLIDGSTKKRTSPDGVSQPVPDSVAAAETSVQNDAQTPLSQLPVTIWGEKNVDATQNNIGKPMCFLGLTVKMEKGNRVVNLYTEGEVVAAPNCEKTTKLNTHATALTAPCAAVENVSEATTFVPNKPRDVSGPQTLACASLLDSTYKEPSVTMPEVTQLLWLCLDEPDRDQSVKEKGGTRLWFVATAHDATGAMKLGIPEKQALALTQADNMNTFERKHDANALGFPLFIHARVSRSIKSSTIGSSHPDDKAGELSAIGSTATDSKSPTKASSQTVGFSQTDGQKEQAYVSYVLEDFEVASWTQKEAPNASYQPMVRILNNLPNHDERIIFCNIQDLREDPHYGFKVVFDGVEAPPAACAAVLIQSFNPSVTTSCGDGFKITTDGITSAADTQETASATQPSFTVVGYGSLDDMVRLDPPRGKKSRLALLLVQKIENTTLYMQKAEYIEPSDATGAIHCFARLRKLCQTITPTSSAKRTQTLSREFAEDPANMKKCKVLRAVPTDESLP